MHEPDSPRADRVEELLVQLLELQEPEQEPALESLCAEHREQEQSLRRRFALFQRLLSTVPEVEATGPRQFGEFELVRELGRGGMGVVHLARQSRGGTERLVALKLIADRGLISPQARERFRREAGAAFRLDHPGLCPLLDIGEVDGTPYLVMRYIPGRTLSELIDAARAQGSALALPELSAAHSGSGSQESASSGSQRGGAILAMIEEVARALHFAHEAGLVHRDVKPGNIMVTPEGKPVLLDFGLVRDDAEAGSRLTLSDQPIGTPAYMSPEQISPAAHPLDRTTDVYSLGATLFEAITLRPPFEGQTRERLFQAILAEAPPRLCKLASGASRDLEVVVRTALDKDPAHRYATAFDLAEDLRRVRSHQPILARAPGPARRLKLWMQRNPLASAVLVLLLLSQGVILALAIDARRSAEEALRQRARAMQHFSSARSAVAELTRVAQDQLSDVPWLEPLRRELNGQALEFYEGFLRVEGDDPALRAELAYAQQGSAALLIALADLDAAEARIAQAKASLTQLVEDGSDGAAGHLARTWSMEADLAALRNDSAARRVALGKAVDLMRAEVSRIGTDEARLALGQTLIQLTSLHRELLEPGAARVAIDEARRVLASVGSHRSLKIERSRALGESGRLHRDARDDEAADRDFLAATDVLRSHLERYPQDRLARSLLGSQRLSTGIALRRRRMYAEAEAAYGEARQIFGDLSQVFPGIPLYRANLAQTLNNMGNLANSQGDVERSIRFLRSSIEVGEQLLEEFPEVSSYRDRLAGAYFNLGKRQLLTGSAEGLTSERRALDLFEWLIERDPEDPKFRDLAARSAQELAWGLVRLQQLQAAGPEMVRGRRHAENLVQLAPKSDRAQRTLGFALHNEGWWLADTGQLAESVERLQAAISTREILRQRQPGERSHAALLLQTWVRLGWVLDRIGRNDQVWFEIEAALATWPEAQRQELQRRDSSRFELACADRGLAAQQAREGQADAALESLERALKRLDTFGEGAEQDCERLLCLTQRADLEREDGEQEAAQASCREAAACAASIDLDGLAGPFYKQRMRPGIDALKAHLPADVPADHVQAIDRLDRELGSM